MGIGRGGSMQEICGLRQKSQMYSYLQVAKFEMQYRLSIFVKKLISYRTGI